MPSKKHKRYKLLLDEGLPPKEAFPQTNSQHNLRHIKHDLKNGGASDSKVYTIANKQDRMVVVLNTKDFRPLIDLNKQSVIALSASITNHQADLKICKVLLNLKPSEAKGFLISISNSGIIINRVIKKRL